MQDNIFSFVRETKRDYETKTIKITEGWDDYNQNDRVNTNELYYNSRFKSGRLDGQGIEKGFYNIGAYKVRLETTATDFDTKDYVIESEDSSDYTRSWLLTKENQIWMKEAHFDRKSNEIGLTRAKQGGTLVKKVESDDTLSIEVPEWKDLITDQTDILSGVIIERHFYTPAQLRSIGKQLGWDKDAISKAIKSSKKNKDDIGEANATDTPGNYIAVYEVHGELPEIYLYDEGDEDSYVRQMHVVTNIENFIQNEDGTIEEEGIRLFRGIEDECPYKLTVRDMIPGRALGLSVIEETEEAQVAINDYAHDEKKIMKLASKVVVQTGPNSRVANNVITKIDNGAIIKTESPLARLELAPSSLPQFQNLIDRWNKQAEQATSSYNAMTGEQMPAGTPYRLAAQALSQASSIFDYRREELGIFYNELYEDWILPFLIKKLKKAHTLAADFTPDELKVIDTAYATYETNRRVIKDVLSGKANIDVAKTKEQILGEIRRSKNRRFIEIPEGYYDNIKAKVRIVTTNEGRIKSVYLESLFNILTQVAQNPQILQDPKLSKIFNQIMETAGFSPSLIADIDAQPAPQPADMQQPTLDAMKTAEQKPTL